jgi:quinol monooxygenase YgiN
VSSISELQSRTQEGRAMYQFVVSFTVPADHREDFVRAAQRSARDSLANEPGARRFEVIADEENPELLYLNEAYADAAAFQAHASGPYFGAFFAEVSPYAQGPNFLMRGEVVSG